MSSGVRIAPTADAVRLDDCAPRRVPEARVERAVIGNRSEGAVCVTVELVLDRSRRV